MKHAAVIAMLAVGTMPAGAANGRYACTPSDHQLVLDFAAGRLTFDGATGTLQQGAATWRGTAGGHDVVVAPGENGAKSVFDVSIDGGRTYGGFVVCRRL